MKKMKKTKQKRKRKKGCGAELLRQPAQQSNTQKEDEIMREDGDEGQAEGEKTKAFMLKSLVSLQHQAKQMAEAKQASV